MSGTNGPRLATVPSPCINVCRMDEATGLCAGCLRTLDEIAVWSMLDDATRRDVLDAIAQRRFTLEETRMTQPREAPDQRRTSEER